MSQSWSIIVFNYNEEVTVRGVIEGAISALEEMKITDYEVVVVDDGSADNSVNIIKETAQRNPRINFVKHEVNKGIGQTLIDGYNTASKENICAIPADGQFDIREILPYANVTDKNFVSFYRVENTSYGLFRNILSGVNRWVNKYLIGMNLKDVNWVKIYKNHHLKNLDLQLTSSLVESEICAKLIFNGNKPLEVQSRYLERTAGKSRGASFSIVFKAARETLTLVSILRKYKRYLNNQGKQ